MKRAQNVDTDGGGGCHLLRPFPGVGSQYYMIPVGSIAAAYECYGYK